MWAKRVTVGLLIAVIAALIGWDIYVASNGVRGDTISEITLAFSRKVITLPLALGVVVGHLLWPTTKPRPGWMSASILVAVGVIGIVVDVVGHSQVMPALPFAIGALIGHFGWGQREE